MGEYGDSLFLIEITVNDEPVLNVMQPCSIREKMPLQQQICLCALVWHSMLSFFKKMLPLFTYSHLPNKRACLLST